MGASLKAKLTAGALGLVLVVCAAIIFAVSFLINRQNLQAVQRDLRKAENICQTELTERQNNLSGEINRMVVENSLGATVKFLYEFSDSQLSMTESTYHKAAGSVASKAMAIGFRHLALYDLDGNLQVFAVKETPESFLFGFYKSPQTHTNRIKKGESVDESAWQASEQPDIANIAVKLDGELPAESRQGFIKIGRLLCMEVLIPVFGTDYDDNGDPVSMQFGVVHGVKEIGKDFVNRLHLLTGMSVNVFAGNQLSIGLLDSFTQLTPEILNAPESGEDLKDIRFDDQRYFFRLLPTKNQSKITGSVAILQSDRIVKENTFQMIKILVLVCLACLVLIIPLVILFAKSIVRPILHIVDKMKDIAEGDGDLRDRITVTAKDEIGQLADNFNQFVEKIQIMISQVKDNLTLLNDSSSSLSEISSNLAAGALQSSDKANGVAASGEEMSTNMTAIAATMEQAAANISMVSSNARQMSDSISEVQENTQTASQISEEAVSQARQASSQVSTLGQAASEIEHVVETITDISEQVNLLALNATIEAARAGEAGKGFAVVAGEIKALANQTASASDEIKQKVLDIQRSTGATITQIETITRVNNDINDIVQETSRKIGEQSAATGEIAENVSQASQGFAEVNENVSQSSTVAAEIAREITDVTHTAEEISNASARVKTRATELSGLSEQLKQIVDRFKV